jgi:hypothetical protein
LYDIFRLIAIDLEIAKIIYIMKIIQEICLTTVGYFNMIQWMTEGMGNCVGYWMGFILARQISLPSQIVRTK